MKQYSFERLEVYQDIREYIKQIYLLTSLFTEKEKFGLCSQLQRAAISIASNIAEGTSRSSNKEKLRFVEISFSSLMETYCQLQIALDLAYIDTKQLDTLKIQIDKIAIKLSGLRRSYSTSTA